MKLNLVKPQHKKLLGGEFDGWMVENTLSERNHAALSDTQLVAIYTARSEGVTPVQLGALCRISVYKIHKHLNYYKNLLRGREQASKKTDCSTGSGGSETPIPDAKCES